MTILSLDDLNNSVDEIYGRKKKTAENIIAPKKSALSTFNPSQPMAEPTPEVAPDILHPTDLHKAVLDAYSNTPTTEMPTKASFMSQLGRGIASLADVAYEPVPSTLGAVTQAVARPFTTPKKAEELGGQVTSSLNQPFGKAFGVTETPEYKQEASRALTDLISKYGNIGAEKLTELAHKSGIPYLKDLPVEDVRNMVGTLAAGVAPEAGKAVGKELKMVGNAIKEKLPSVRVELQKQLENKQIPTEKVGSVGAASVENNPYANQITGEENVRGQFPQVKLSKISEDVSKNEQIIRSKIANEILGDAGHVRSGVITGNENQLRNEHTQANMPNPTLEGQLYKQQIANEQNALSNYAQERVNATGASPTLINDEQRGMRINDAFHSQSGKGETPTSIIDYLNKAKDVVYKDAYNKVGNNVIQTTNIDNLLKNEQFKAGLEFKGNQGVASGASQLLKLAKEVGIEDEAGVVHPAGSVAAYDAVRKAMNSEWTPQNASAIRKINTAIDKDIAAVADPSLYKLGDRIHEAEKTIFESKGIKSLFGETDKNGVITSSTPLEKIPTKLNNLPKDQWRHIRDTLEDLSNGKIRGAPEGMPPIPEELKKQALAAKNEIDGALAREVYKAGANKAGVWNQNSANNVLNSIIGEKIVETFPPEEIKKFHTLNYGGHIMPGIHNYEGSGLQNRRVGLIEGNIEKAATGVGAATGGVVAGPVGAAVGGYLGGKAGSIAKESIAIKELTKAAEKAKNEMKKNAQLGKNKLNDIGKP